MNKTYFQPITNVVATQAVTFLCASGMPEGNVEKTPLDYMTGD